MTSEFATVFGFPLSLLGALTAAAVAWLYVQRTRTPSLAWSHAFTVIGGASVLVSAAYQVVAARLGGFCPFCAFSAMGITVGYLIAHTPDREQGFAGRRGFLPFALATGTSYWVSLSLMTVPTLSSGSIVRDVPGEATLVQWGADGVDRMYVISPTCPHCSATLIRAARKAREGNERVWIALIHGDVETWTRWRKAGSLPSENAIRSLFVESVGFPLAPEIGRNHAWAKRAGLESVPVVLQRTKEAWTVLDQ